MSEGEKVNGSKKKREQIERERERADEGGEGGVISVCEPEL